MIAPATFREWAEAGGTERRSRRVRRVRSADGCRRQGGHLMGFPCGGCDRAEAVAEELERRPMVDALDEAGFCRGEAARVLAFIGAERRAWMRNRARRGRAAADVGLRPMGEWGREQIARARWYAARAARVLP